MANRIVGLDIGSWAVKAVAIEMQRGVEVVAYREIELGDIDGRARSEGADGTVNGTPADDAGGEPADGNELFPEVDGEEESIDGGDDEFSGPGWDDTDEGDGGGDWSDAGVDTDDQESEWVESAGDGLSEPLDQDWVRAIRRLVSEGFFEGVNRVITSIPGDQSATLHLEVPFERPEDVAEILPHVLMDELPMPVDEIVYDFVVVPRNTIGEFEALLGFVSRDGMREFLDETQTAGVDPAVVGVPELMLRRAGERAASPGVEQFGVIDIGHRYTRLLIMSEGKPVVAHTTRNGGASITSALAENFQITEDEARQLKHNEGVVGSAASGGDRRVRKIQGTIEESLRPIVRDLRRTFQSAYAKYRVAVDEIYICGGTSRLDGLDDFLRGEFDVDVQRMELDHGISWFVDADSRDRQPEATLGLSTALEVVAEDADKSLVDFRQDEFVYRGKSSYLHTQLVRLGAIAAVLVVLLAGVMLMQHYDQRTQLAAMQQAVSQESSELFGESVTEPPEVQARLEGEGASQRNFIPRMSAYELMVAVVDEISDDIELELERLEVDNDRSIIQMVGRTDSPQAVDRLAGDVENLECLTDVSKEQVNVEGDDEVQFELQITSGCA